MKRLLLIGWICVIGLAGCKAALDPTYTAADWGEPDEVFFATSVEWEGEMIGVDMPYYIYLPPGYADHPNREYPLLITLHGATIDSRGFGRIETPGLPAPFLEDPNRYPFIRVYPLAPVGFDWAFVHSGVIGLLDHLIATYQVDEDRVYLQGFSMGGAGVWGIASHHADRFTAVAMIAGYWPYPYDMRHPDTVCNIDIPVWIVHGQNDEDVPQRTSNGLADILETCNEAVVYNRDADFTHLGAIDFNRDDPAFYAWLLEQ